MIELLHEDSATVRWVDEPIGARRDLHITPHVFYELFRGVRRSSDPARQGRFIARIGEKFRLLPFDRDTALLAARMANELEDGGHRVPELDIFIAATAVVWGDGEILTRDVSHFTRLRRFGLTVLES